jgi:hypothetical protein
LGVARHSREFWGFGVPPQGKREETLVNLVATKPA